MEKEAKIEWQKLDKKYYVCLSDNGYAWSIVLQDEDIKKCLTILEAYERIGYKDVSVRKWKIKE